MLGWIGGGLIGAMAVGLVWRASATVERAFERWSAEFDATLAEPTSDDEKARRIDEGLGDLTIELERGAFVPPAAVRLGAFLGAACGAAFGLRGAWVEALTVVPGVVLGVVVAGRQGQTLARRSADMRRGVDSRVDQEARVLAAVQAPSTVRRRRRSRRR